METFDNCEHNFIPYRSEMFRKVAKWRQIEFHTNTFGWVGVLSGICWSDTQKAGRMTWGLCTGGVVRRTVSQA